MQAHVLLELFDPVLTIGPASVHPGHQFGGTGHGRDSDAVVRVGRTLDQVAPPCRPLGQRLAQTHEPPGLAAPHRQGDRRVGNCDAGCDPTPRRFGVAVQDEVAEDGRQPRDDDRGEVSRFQVCQEGRLEKARIRPHQADREARRHARQCLRDELPHAVGCPRMPRP